MLIATWNVNSIKSRQKHVLSWLKSHKPDVLMLQELKVLDFPAKPFEDLGYKVEAVTQRTYNGVATLSRHKIKVISRKLAGDASDKQARYLETEIKGIRIINIYLPNGNPIGTDKFQYKLKWMDRLKKRMTALKRQKIPTIIGGDYNVIPEDIDCFSTNYWKNDALFQPEPRERFRKYQKAGFIDAFRYFNQEKGHYTFWEYVLNHWQNNRGIRIDHFLVSPNLEKRMTGCMIDKGPRGKVKPSDHTPIILAVN